MLIYLHRSQDYEAAPAPGQNADLVDKPNGCHVPEPAVKERIMKLEEKGFITGYRTEFNLQRLERGTTSFILMKTEQCQALADFCEQAPEVTDLHRISGEFNYLIKVKTTSVEELADFQDSIASMGPSKSLISLKNLLENRVVL